MSKNALFLRVSKATLLALAMGGATATHAATATGTIAVSATVLSSCLLATSPMVFGNYNPSTQSTATAALTVTCSNGISYTVAINEGANGGTTTTRLMSGPGSDTLGYKVWQNAGFTTNWDNAGSTVAGTGSGLPQILTVYGTIQAGQSVAPGAYTDTLTVTVTY
ncbi:MAG TPA: spore coat U domain-containing protein [Limnobacter sp.]|nr:spore coat U domain-containing protein [Limnobacter sp.]